MAQPVSLATAIRWLNSALVSLALFIERVSPIYELIGSRISNLAWYFSTASRIRSSLKVRLFSSSLMKMSLSPSPPAELPICSRNAETLNLTPLYGFGVILGIFFRYERLYFGGGILIVRHSKAAVCRFRVTKKRRIATTLLSCSGNCFFYLTSVGLCSTTYCLCLSFFDIFRCYL